MVADRTGPTDRPAPAPAPAVRAAVSTIPVAGVVNIANALTVFRVALVPVFAALLLTDGGHRTGWRVAAWAVFAVAAFTDRLDGEVARRRGLVTDFGKIADPIADKALIGTALAGLAVLGDLPWWIVVVVLGREIGVTLLRFWVIRKQVIPAGRGGKVKTFLQSVAIGLYVLPLPGWSRPACAVLLGVAVVLTVVTGIDYAVQVYRIRRSRQDVPPSARDMPEPQPPGTVSCGSN